MRRTLKTLALWDKLAADYQKQLVRGYRKGAMSSQEENDQRVSVFDSLEVYVISGRCRSFSSFPTCFPFTAVIRCDR